MLQIARHLFTIDTGKRAGYDIDTNLVPENYGGGPRDNFNEQWIQRKKRILNYAIAMFGD